MSLPVALLLSLQNTKGFSEEAFKAVHQSGEQVTSVRLNPEKFKIQNSKFKTEEKVLWNSNGFYLKERPSFTLDPLFHAGAYYVQEASSMFLEEAIKQAVDVTKPLKVLDLCAAPGGKSTLIQSILSKESLLVANEAIKTRVNILTENITKWGASNVIVTNNDPKDLQRLPNYFDVIVVDAPCSGSGLFRKDANAINEWSENNVALCAQRQQRILADIMPSLKDGGVLIYSTCSYSKEEDEEICTWLLEKYAMSNLQYAIPEDWGIVESGGGYRFYPDKLKGEGFFIAAFRKPQGMSSKEETSAEKHHKKIAKFKTGQLTQKEIEVLNPYLKNADDFFFIKQNDEAIAVPIHLEDDLQAIQSSLYIKKAGIRLGTVIRGELVPAHDLAVSNVINTSVAQIEVDKETALQYLRRADIKIESALTGWVLLTHQQLPIGWIKNIGNRINNYYPKDWRILNK